MACCLKCVVDMVGDGIREFVNDTDGSAFLKNEAVGFGVDRYR